MIVLLTIWHFCIFWCKDLLCRECQTCKWWDGKQESLAEELPYSLKSAKHKLCIKSFDLADDSDNTNADETINNKPIVTTDGSGYWSACFTLPDHYCKCWERKNVK